MSQFIGKQPTISQSSASGIWDLQDQLLYNIQNLWPPVPLSTLTYVTSGENGATLTTGSSHTFSGVSVGTAASDRHVILGIARFTNGSATVTGVTLAGNSMTQIGTEQISATGTAAVSLWRYNLTTGTTADIVVSLSAAETSWDVGYGVWNLNGASGAPSSSAQTGTGAGGAVTATITAPRAGSAVLGFGMNVNETTGTSSITNCTDEVERFDFDFRSGEFMSGVDGTATAAANCDVTSGAAELLHAVAWN